MRKNDLVSPPPQNQLAYFIKEQIEAPSNCLLQESHTISAAKLILSGIDLMGYLTLPDGRQRVASYAFKKWTEDYLDLVNSGQVSSEEIWQTRCDLLHAHGYRDHAEDKPLRYISLSTLTTPPAYEGSDSIELVHVSVDDFLQDFLLGAKQCIAFLYGQTETAIRTQNRLEHVQYVRRLFVTFKGRKVTFKGKPVTFAGGLKKLRDLP